MFDGRMVKSWQNFDGSIHMVENLPPIDSSWNSSQVWTLWGRISGAPSTATTSTFSSLVGCGAPERKAPAPIGAQTGGPEEGCWHHRNVDELPSPALWCIVLLDNQVIYTVMYVYIYIYTYDIYWKSITSVTYLARATLVKPQNLLMLQGSLSLSLSQL